MRGARRGRRTRVHAATVRQGAASRWSIALRGEGGQRGSRNADHQRRRQRVTLRRRPAGVGWFAAWPAAWARLGFGDFRDENERVVAFLRASRILQGTRSFYGHVSLASF
jgi:hypothetical protein